jgi:hypothetical protein
MTYYAVLISSTDHDSSIFCTLEIIRASRFIDVAVIDQVVEDFARFVDVYLDECACLGQFEVSVIRRVFDEHLLVFQERCRNYTDRGTQLKHKVN